MGVSRLGIELRRPPRVPTTTPAARSPHISAAVGADYASRTWGREPRRRVRQSDGLREEDSTCGWDWRRRDCVPDSPKFSKQSRMSGAGRRISGQELQYAECRRSMRSSSRNSQLRGGEHKRSPVMRGAMYGNSGPAASSLRRDKNGETSRRRGYFVLDVRQLENQRKIIRKDQRKGVYPRPVTERAQHGRRRRRLKSCQGASRASNLSPSAGYHSPRAFSMLTLNEYLRERPRLLTYKVHEMDIAKDVSGLYSPAGKLKLLAQDVPKPRTQRAKASRNTLMKHSISQGPKIRKVSTNQHLVYNFDNSRTRASALVLASRPSGEAVHDEDIDALSVQRQGCGIPWHWSRAPKYTGNRIMDLAGKSLSCGFPVSRRRKSRKTLPRSRSVRVKQPRSSRYKWSVSFSDSSSETAPLLITEQKRYNDYSENIANLASDSPSRTQDLQEAFVSSRSTGLPDRTTFVTEETHGYGGMPRRLNHRPREEKHRSLSQKYRPKTFKEMVGQNMVAQALSNAILRGKIAPVYLFQGPRGTGKTTAARIFATAMNCLAMEGSLIRPCGACRECVGKSLDVRQINAAGDNGIESMRMLLKLVGLCPQSSSRYKVFIIDECHMLTREAWNAFLKMLEEPPSYVVFILITTDPEQLPRTVVSRCQKFPFPKIKDGDILARLQKLARLENVDIEGEALELITARSDGSLRDAETTLDQLSILEQKVTTAMVRELVGLIPDDKLVELLEMALSGDTVNTVRCIRALMESGVEPLALMSQLASLITDLLAGDMSAKDSSVHNVFSGHHLSKDELEKLRQALKILSEAEKQLRACSNRITWLTAALLQFCPVESYLLPPSPLGTSVTQSPIAFLDTSEKETIEPDLGTIRPPWEDGEQWDNSQLQLTTSDEKRNRIANSSTSMDFSCGESHISPVAGYLTQPYNFQSGRNIISTAGENLQAPALEYSGDVSEVARRDANMMSPCTMDDIWRKVLERSSSNVLRQLLSGDAKLLSLSVSEAYAIAHLEFQYLEDKLRAERVKARISNAFQEALGCPVEVEISFAQGEQVKMRRESTVGAVRRNANATFGKSLKHGITSRVSCHGIESVYARHGAHYAGSSSGERYMWSHGNQSGTSYRYAHDIQGTKYFSAGTNSFIIGEEVDRRVDEYSQSLLYDSNNASLRVERNSDDSGNSKCLAEHELESYYEQKSLSPGFRTGYGSLLCWKGFRTKEQKVRRHKPRRRKKIAFLLNFVPCASAQTN